MVCSALNKPEGESKFSENQMIRHSLDNNVECAFEVLAVGVIAKLRDNKLDVRQSFDQLGGLPDWMVFSVQEIRQKLTTN